MSRSDIELYLAELSSPLEPALRELCAIVRDTDPRIGEEIKWNAPSFFLTGHFATTNLRPRGPLLLVLHSGVQKRDVDLRAAVHDPGGLLDWKSGDRAILSFPDLAAVTTAAPQVHSILGDWIAATQ